jgi:hypothetical protein
LLALAALLAGSALYILFRPTSILLFQWADSLALMDRVGVARGHASVWRGVVPDWVIFSLPFALWVFSYLLLVDVRWTGQSAVWRGVYFWIVPIIAVAAELAQAAQVLPGHFDPVDLMAIILATCLALGLRPRGILKTKS